MSTSNIPVQLTGIETLTPPERSQAFAVLTSDVLTSYRKPEFFGRFRNAVAASDEYDGRLPATWEQTEFLERGVSDVDPSLLDIGLQDAVHLHQTARRLINAGAMTAVIEAAHVYAYESLDDPDILGSVLAQSRQAALLGGLLRSHGIKVRQMLFIDDYNVDPTSGKLMDILQTDDLVEATSSVGFVPEMILREASMVGLAKEIIRVMDQEQKLVVASESESLDVSPDLYLSRRNIELYRGGEDVVSCAMLDAALTIIKLRYLGEGVINVLPTTPPGQQFGSYRGQQSKMRTIVGEHLGARVSPITNIFVGVSENKGNKNRYGAHNVLRKSRL